MRKRNSLVAGLFNAMSPGLGFLYLGKWPLAIGTLGVLLLLVAVGAWTKLIFVPFGLLSVTLLVLGAWVCSIVVAWRMARHNAATSLHKFQRWYVYVGFFLFASIFLHTLFGNRARIFGYEMFKVPSSSMRETLLPGDYFISNAWKYLESEPERGDIVIFQYPRDPSKYVQRVIGLPGEVIRVGTGEVRVNGVVLNEPYVARTNNQGLPVGNGEFRVPDHSYFILGDNRDHSNDSRFRGSVPREGLHGRTEFIWLSYDTDKGLRTERLGQRVR